MTEDPKTVTEELLEASELTKKLLAAGREVQGVHVLVQTEEDVEHGTGTPALLWKADGALMLLGVQAGLMTLLIPDAESLDAMPSHPIAEMTPRVLRGFDLLTEALTVHAAEGVTSKPVRPLRRRSSSAARSPRRRG